MMGLACGEGTISRSAARKAAVARRVRASLYDLLPIWGWLGGVAVVSGLLTVLRINPFPRLFAKPATADLTNFALTILPVGLLLSKAEASDAAASWGKRRAGLRVVNAGGEPPSIGQAALRNAVKFSAWQAAHLGLLRVTGTIPYRHARVFGATLLWSTYLVAAADVAPALVRTDSRALHDLAANTRVVLA